jgi:hypothetical protein
MSSPPEALAQLAVQLAQQGDFAGAGDALGRAAHAYRARGLLADAARVWIAAARMATAADRPDRAARFLADADAPARATGQLAELLAARAELADQTADAPAREAAWRACVEAGDPELASKAWHRIGALARELLDAPLLHEAIEQALAIAVAGDDRNAEADLRIELAVAVAPGDPRRALAELDRVEAALDGASSELRSRLLGQRGVVALIEERLDDAAAFARESRALAVEANAVPSYLAATSLLVMIHERRNDHLAALDEILRARASLIDLLGEQGGALVDPALAMFEDRIGSERYRELVAAWRAARSEARRR